LDRQKRPGSDVQGNKMARNPPVLQPLHQLRGKMQAGSRSSYRPFLPRIDRLVILAVAQVVWAPCRDIGWKRNVSGLMQGRIECVPRPVEDQHHLAPFAFLRDNGFQDFPRRYALGTKQQPVLLPQPLGGLDECLPSIRAGSHMQRRFDPRLASLTQPDAEEPCWNDPAIVENQRISWVQAMRQVGYQAITH